MNPCQLSKIKRVKYHNCKSKGTGVIVQKPLLHTQIDRHPW